MAEGLPPTDGMAAFVDDTENHMEMEILRDWKVEIIPPPNTFWSGSGHVRGDSLTEAVGNAVAAIYVQAILTRAGG